MHYFGGISKNEYKEKVKNGCAICGFKEVIMLHHINGTQDNKNLIPLCPNHHTILHKKHKSIEQMREEYENDRIRQGQHQGSKS